MGMETCGEVLCIQLSSLPVVSEVQSAEWSLDPAQRNLLPSITSLPSLSKLAGWHWQESVKAWIWFLKPSELKWCCEKTIFWTSGLRSLAQWTISGADSLHWISGVESWSLMIFLEPPQHRKLPELFVPPRRSWAWKTFGLVHLWMPLRRRDSYPVKFSGEEQGLSNIWTMEEIRWASKVWIVQNEASVFSYLLRCRWGGTGTY